MDTKDLLRDFILESPDERTRVERMGIAHDIYSSFSSFWREQTSELLVAIQAKLSEESFRKEDGWQFTISKDTSPKYSGLSVYNKKLWTHPLDRKQILSLSIDGDESGFNKLFYGVKKGDGAINATSFIDVLNELKNYDNAFTAGNLWIGYKYLEKYKQTDTLEFCTAWMTKRGREEIIMYYCSLMNDLKDKMETIMDSSIAAYIQQSKVQGEV